MPEIAKPVPAVTPQMVPYAVVMIKLKEGPAIVSNLPGVKPDQIRCGMPVEVVFEKVNDQASLRKFRPRAAG